MVREPPRVDGSHQNEKRMNHSILGDVFGWVQHPLYSPGNVGDWAVGLLLLLILAFLWGIFINHEVE